MRKDGPDILVFPPLVSVAAPVAAIGMEWLVPLAILPRAGQAVILVPGVVLMVLAGWLAVSGTRAFKAVGTNIDPRDEALVLVSGGPYRLTRNPMYLGMVLLQFALALAFSLDWALIGAVVVWFVLHYGVVLREEAYLAEKFGAPYTKYLSQRRRWL